MSAVFLCARIAVLISLGGCAVDYRFPERLINTRVLVRNS